MNQLPQKLANTGSINDSTAADLRAVLPITDEEGLAALELELSENSDLKNRLVRSYVVWSPKTDKMFTCIALYFATFIFLYPIISNTFLIKSYNNLQLLRAVIATDLPCRSITKIYTKHHLSLGGSVAPRSFSSYIWCF